MPQPDFKEGIAEQPGEKRNQKFPLIITTLAALSTDSTLKTEVQDGQQCPSFRGRMHELQWALLIFITGLLVTAATVVMIVRGHLQTSSERSSGDA